MADLSSMANDQKRKSEAEASSSKVQPKKHCNFRTKKLLVSEAVAKAMEEWKIYEEIFYFAAPGADHVDRELWNKHLKQCEESEGFDVTCFPDCLKRSLNPVYGPFGPDSDYAMLASTALDKFNSDDQVEKYALDKVVTVNYGFDAGYIYYITFQAVRVNDTDGPFVTFQAKVWECITPREVQVLFCRIKASP